MDWKHGYYADSGYTFGYYSETMPARLRYAALIQGQQAPADKFRYLDAGCGQGLNLILAAACHPDSEFVGVDFLPEHIAHATALARRCGLTNVTFVEGDFTELVADPFRFGQFDYAVCHGITTWIAPPVKQALFRWIGLALKPGGLFYNSYNTFPGWLAAVPFQHLVLLEQRSKTGELALKTARASMEALMKAAPAMFGALPGLEARLKIMETQDASYLVQEYNNQYWQPVFVTEMIDAMASVKLQYLGTATLPEAFDSALSVQVRELLAAQNDPVVREQLRDYALAQSFRRDLYVKGRSQAWKREAEAQIRAIRLARNPLTARPEEGKPYSVKAGALEVNGAVAFYSGLLDLIESGKEGRSIGEIVDAQESPQHKQAVGQAVSMLLHGAWVTLLDPQRIGDASKKTNRAIVDAALQGAPYRYLAVPKAMSALVIGDTEWAMLEAALRKIPVEQWTAIVRQDLLRRGRSLAKDGQAVTDPAAQEAILARGVQEFAGKKFPWLRSLAAL